MKLKYLKDKWDENTVSKLDEPEKLRYRSNLLGSDLRITNFGGGNTSSKIKQKDPLTGEEAEVLWVKGSGGDLGSMKIDGFAQIYMNKFLLLKRKYRGKEHEDEMVDYYPLCKFGGSTRPASIDTPLHGLLTYQNVDHLHPDWGIAIAASANGKKLLDEFNKNFNYNLIWLPWKRPGFHLGKMLEDAVRENPKAEGAVMASHGIITWGNGQYQCYRNTIEIIDAMGQFVMSKFKKKGELVFGGDKHKTRDDRREVAEKIFPYVRGKVGVAKLLIGNYVDNPEVLSFVNSSDAEKLAFHGTSCPDHFTRTKVRPFYVKWNSQNQDLDSLKKAIESGLIKYRQDYKEYYETNREKDSPQIRDPNPTVVLIPGIGMLSFGKNKKEARITGEAYVNAIRVMEGATSMADNHIDEGADESRVINNYVSLSPREAFNIEYWELEEAKLKRQPAEKEMSGQVAVVVGGGSGIGREFCYRLVKEGTHVAVADLNQKTAEETVQAINDRFGTEMTMSTYIDITDRNSVRESFKKICLEFGGFDVLINTAAIFIPPDMENSFQDSIWDKTFQVNITGNYIITDEFAQLIEKQGSKGSVLLTSSANAVVPKSGSEPYDVSKSAVNHLIRELAIRHAPNIRVNGVSPATVIEGSTMFPRDRVIVSLKKYGVEFNETEETTMLLDKLSKFYARRTLTHRIIRPTDVVESGYFLVSSKSDRITGHIIPIDGGIKEAFLR